MWKAAFTKTKCKNLDKENFPPFLKQVYESSKCFTRLHATTGFQYTGLFPLNKNSINQLPSAISETFNPPTSSTQLPATQSLPLSCEPATAPTLPSTSASSFDKYKALHESMKNEMENEMKSFSHEKIFQKFLANHRAWYYQTSQKRKQLTISKKRS